MTQVENIDIPVVILPKYLADRYIANTNKLFILLIFEKIIKNLIQKLNFVQLTDLVIKGHDKNFNENFCTSNLSRIDHVCASINILHGISS